MPVGLNYMKEIECVKENKYMKRIYFRAWYTEKKKMYEVAKIDIWGDPDQATCDLASNDEELFGIYLNEVEIMQYIGIKDKYGISICEGDIIQTHFSFSPGDAGYGISQKPFIVKWEEGSAGFRAYKPNAKTLHLLDIIDFFEMQSNLYEVIGNIYEKLATQ